MALRDRASKASVMPVPIQVAAVCYRRASAGIEFLLVRTSSGRWIFPKGRMDDSLSNREAAAREAWEEAGAMGIIGPRAFHVFRYSKGDPEQDTVLVEAYLLEVLRSGLAKEEHREPTWFTAEEGKRAISDCRDTRSASELAAVIDLALATLGDEAPKTGLTRRRSISPSGQSRPEPRLRARPPAF